VKYLAQLAHHIPNILPVDVRACFVGKNFG